QSFRVACCGSFPRRQCRFSIRAVAIASAPRPVRTFVRAIGLGALAPESLAIADPMGPYSMLGPTPSLPKTPDLFLAILEHIDYVDEAPRSSNLSHPFLLVSFFAW